MKLFFTERRTGFTVVELTLAMTISMLVATGLLMLLGQQTAYTKEVNSFRFLRQEASQVNSLVSQLVSKSVSYRIHATPGDAFGGVSAVNTGGTAVRLLYRNPSGLVDQSVIAFETINGESQLNYYRFNNGAWPAQPNWTITSQATNVTFADDLGVLLITLVGPYNEQITYSGTTQ